MDKRIGKIKSIRCGYGGYQDAMIGFTVDLGSDKEAWGVVAFEGDWALDRSDNAKWTEEDRIKRLGEAMMWLNNLLKKAKVDTLDKLNGVPVEVEFERMTLKSWRILEEVI